MIFFFGSPEQLLSLDLESLISQGMASLSKKQKLIDEALNQSYEIAPGGGAFGHCLVYTSSDSLHVKDGKLIVNA